MLNITNSMSVVDRGVTQGNYGNATNYDVSGSQLIEPRAQFDEVLLRRGAGNQLFAFGPMVIIHWSASSWVRNRNTPRRGSLCPDAFNRPVASRFMSLATRSGSVGGLRQPTVLPMVSSRLMTVRGWFTAAS